MNNFKLTLIFLRWESSKFVKLFSHLYTYHVVTEGTQALYFPYVNKINNKSSMWFFHIFSIHTLSPDVSKSCI